jgi:DNA-binding transcriptional LysR family regulator
MEINQLKAFTVVAETNSFFKAAQSLGLTTEQISEVVASLENSVGFQLLTNNSDNVVLTEFGERVYQSASMLLRNHADLVKEIAEIAGNASGRLRIGSASAMFTTEQLPEILDGLRGSFSGAEISVFSGTSKVLVERILRGEIDIAFVSLPVESLDIRTELLFSDEIVAIAHPKHSLANEDIISAATLAGERLILGEKGGNTRRMIDDLFEQANVKPNVVMELSRQDSIVKMVENNMGVGLSGVKNIAPKVRQKKLVSWLIEGAEIRWNLGLASLRGGYVSPIAAEFIRLCKENSEKKEKAFMADNKS